MLKVQFFSAAHGQIRIMTLLYQQILPHMNNSILCSQGHAEADRVCISDCCDVNAFICLHCPYRACQVVHKHQKNNIKKSYTIALEDINNLVEQLTNKLHTVNPQIQRLRKSAQICLESIAETINTKVDQIEREAILQFRPEIQQVIDVLHGGHGKSISGSKMKYFLDEVEAGRVYKDRLSDEEIQLQIDKIQDILDHLQQITTIITKKMQNQTKRSGLKYLIGKQEYKLQRHQQLIDNAQKWVSKSFTKRGKYYDILNRKQSAIKDYTQAIELDPQNDEAFNNRGIILFEAKDYERAIQDFNQSIECSTKNNKVKEEYFNNRGAAYLMTEKNAQAQKNFEAAIELNPNYPEAYHNLAKLYQKTLAHQMALDNYLLAAQKDTSNPQRYYNCCLIYELMYKKDNNKECLAKALKQINLALKLHTRSKKYLLKRAEMYQQRRQFKLALQDYDIVVQVAEDDSVHILKGDVYLIQFQYLLALEEYNLALQIRPTNHLALVKKSIVFFHHKNLEAALRCLNQAITYKSDFSDIYYNKGRIYQQMCMSAGEHANNPSLEQAVRNYNMAIRLDERDYQSYCGLAVCHRYVCDYKQALKCYANALKIINFIRFSRSSTTRYGQELIYNNRGVVYFQEGNDQLAILDFNNAIRLNGCYAEPYMNRAKVYCKWNMYKEAQKDYDKLLELGIEQSSVYDEKGQICYQLKQYSQAIQCFKQAIKLSPLSAKYKYHLSICLHALNKHQEALTIIKEAILLNHKNCDYYLREGQYYFAMSKFNLAELSFNSANLVDKKMGLVYIYKALVYVALGKSYDLIKQNINEAIQLEPDNLLYYHERACLYTMNLNSLDDSIKDLMDVLEKAPTKFQSSIELGKIYMIQKNYDQALKWFQNAIDVEYRALDCYIQRAKIYLKQKEYLKAEKDLKFVIQNDAQNVSALYLMGIMYQKTNQFAEAIQYFTQLISKDPDDYRSYYKRGQSYALSNQIQYAYKDLSYSALNYNHSESFAEIGHLNLKNNRQAAEQNFRKAIEINKQNSNAYLGLGLVYSALNRNKQAIEQLTLAIKTNRRNTKAYHERANIYVSINQLDLAYQDLTTAISKQQLSKLSDVYCDRAMIALKKLDIRQAWADICKAIQINPKNARAHNNAGKVQMAYQKYTQSISSFNKSIELDPDYPRGYYNRGLAYQKIPDYEKAVADFSTAITLCPQQQCFYISRHQCYVKLNKIQEANRDKYTIDQFNRKSRN